MMKTLFILSITIFTFLVFAQDVGKKVAKVKIKKGQAISVFPDGSTAQIKRGEWLVEGTVVKTKARSFVKLIFIDKSTMNVGPKSEMKIERFRNDEAGIINVISGKIRSQVSKNYLNMDKGKSKLFIKNKNAVMGIRGTEIMYAVNKKTGATTALLFEGSAVFNKINPGDNIKNLEKIVNKGVRIKPGQFSVAKRGMKRPTMSAKMNKTQFNALKKNTSLSGLSGVKKSNFKTQSIVPKGLTSSVVASDKDIAFKKKTAAKMDSKAFEKSKGFVRDGVVKPADGTIVHIDTGTIVPMGEDKRFDPVNQEWVSREFGGTDNQGNYVPSKEYEVNTSTGKLVNKAGEAVNGANPRAGNNRDKVDGSPEEESSKGKSEKKNKDKQEDTRKPERPSCARYPRLCGKPPVVVNPVKRKAKSKVNINVGKE